MNPLKAVKVYFKLRPVIARAKEILKMKFSLNMVTQIIAMVVQGANALGGILPPEYSAPIALGIAAVQGIVAFVAHFKNPDGTPAAQPYVK